jgi:hypothetical protein
MPLSVGQSSMRLTLNKNLCTALVVLTSTGSALPIGALAHGILTAGKQETT